MKSNICKIESEGRSLEAILRESEKVAVYNELSHKQALHLRLLCEEIGGMIPIAIKKLQENAERLPKLLEKYEKFEETIANM